MSKEIVLGCIAKDKITGFEGVVSAITYWFNKCVRVDIKPTKLKDGAVQEAHSFDIEQLEWRGAGFGVMGNHPLPDGIELGVEAKDKVTGFKGIVFAITHYLSGFKTVHLQPRELDKDKIPAKGLTLESEQLAYVGPGINPEKIIKKEKATGGPMLDVSRGRH